MKMNFLNDVFAGATSHRRGLAKTSVGALVIALAFSLAGLSPAQAQETQPVLDASGIVAANVDTDELETVANAFNSGDAGAAAELATLVAPQNGVDLDDAAQVELDTDGGLTLDNGAGLNLGLSVQGSDVDPDIIDGAAVATGVDTDLDVVSRATNDGAQILAVLGSENAPKQIGFDLDLPEGATLTPQANGSILVTAPTETQISAPGEDERIETAVQEILGADADLDTELTDEQIEQIAAIPDAKTTTVIETLPIAEIEAPWAVDANGNPVTTSYDLNGNTLTQTIETNTNTAYPVVADPSIDWEKVGWWVAQGGKCLGGVVTLAGLGYAKVSVGLARLVVKMKAAKSTSALGKAYAAWKKLGTSDSKRFNTLVSELKALAQAVVKHGYPGIAKRKKASSKAQHVINFGRYGGAAAGAVLGIGGCIKMLQA